MKYNKTCYSFSCCAPACSTYVIQCLAQSKMSNSYSVLRSRNTQIGEASSFTCEKKLRVALSKVTSVNEWMLSGMN